MSMRENIIKLLGDDVCEHDSCENCEYKENRDDCISFLKERMADYLIANDVVQVVRCQDCRHWNSETGFCNLNSHFSMDGLDWDVFNDDDFCSLGERRTDGQAEDDRAV